MTSPRRICEDGILRPQVVLRTRVVRQLDAHAGERVQDQPRRSKPVMPAPESIPLLGPAALPPPPRSRAPPSAPFHGDWEASPVDPPSVRSPAGRGVGDAGVVGLQDAQLLQEAAAHAGGDLRRGGRDPQHLVEHREGSPGTLALGICGSVGSHPSPLAAANRLGGPRGSCRRSRVSAVARPRCTGTTRRPARIRELGRTVWSAACASSRSAAGATCSRWSSNLCLDSVSAATAASWLDFASAAALSAFLCLAAAPPTPCSPVRSRARCRLAMTASSRSGSWQRSRWR